MMKQSPDGSVVGNLDGDLLSRIRHPKLARLYTYWLSRTGDRHFPRRQDIDPLEFGYVLGHVMLVDVLKGARRFYVRLHGTEMVQRAKYDLTKKFLEELPITDYRAYVLERCESLVASGAPSVVRQDRILDGHVTGYEALWLPFSDDGQAITMLLCALFYDDES